MLQSRPWSISAPAMDSPSDTDNNRAMFSALVDLSHGEFAALAVLVCLAGIVRGFSGFALSAMVMATAVLLLPPVALIPVCWWLEVAASLLMVRGGFAEADRVTGVGPFFGSAVGAPLGLCTFRACAGVGHLVVARGPGGRRGPWWVHRGARRGPDRDAARAQRSRRVGHGLRLRRRGRRGLRARRSCAFRERCRGLWRRWTSTPLAG